MKHSFRILHYDNTLLSANDLFDQAQDLSQRYATGHVTENDLIVMGQALWQSVDSKEISSKSTPEFPCTLALDATDPVSNVLPWECLYHPQQGFLGKNPNYTLVRYVPHFTNKSVPPPPAPLRILLFTAQTFPFLTIEMEQATLRTALAPWINRGLVQLRVSNEGRFAQFVELIQNNSWHVVLLTGHGKSSYIAFEDRWVTAQEFTSVFKNSQVQCVVLATCDSGKTVGNQMSLATQLIQIGIPHVVGMREALVDRAGTVFLRALCVALAQQARIDSAVQQARQALTQLLTATERWQTVPTRMESVDPSVNQWCLPMLFSSNPCQCISEAPLQLPYKIDTKLNNSAVFIGRRAEVQKLERAFYSGEIKQLLIYGDSGVGKTALANQLVTALTERGRRLLTYQTKSAHNMPSLRAQLASLSSFPHKTPWLLWLDGLDSLDADTCLPSLRRDFCALLRKMPLCVVVTARRSLPLGENFCRYPLMPPNYADFLRYSLHLGLVLSPTQFRLIYRTLQGNYRGLQLLQELLFQQNSRSLTQPLAQVQRYLRAYR